MCLICDDESQNTINNETIKLEICRNVTQERLDNVSGLLTNLEEFTCWCCVNLIEIPFIPNLRKLNCFQCHFIELPIFPNLEELRCVNCIYLKKIPFLPKLRILDCTHCQYLSEIPFLPNLLYLNCDYCSYLTNLPLFPFLRKLECNGKHLTLIPENVRCNKKFYKGMIVLSVKFKDWKKSKNKILKNINLLEDLKN